jgi:hypothetical protein
MLPVIPPGKVARVQNFDSENQVKLPEKEDIHTMQSVKGVAKNVSTRIDRPWG